MKPLLKTLLAFLCMFALAVIVGAAFANAV